MAVFKETTIFTEEQKASVFYESESIILRISEENTDDTRLYLTKEEAIELANILTQYSND